MAQLEEGRLRHGADAQARAHARSTEIPLTVLFKIRFNNDIVVEKSVTLLYIAHSRKQLQNLITRCKK